jgi:hypothetical protein
MMAGDWCFNLPWSGKGKNLFVHVMTHPTSGGRAAGELSRCDPPTVARSPFEGC